MHDAITTMTKLKSTTSEQHVDLGVSRCTRDYKDLKKIQEWFNYHEPFDMDEKKLRSLSSGLTAMDAGEKCVVESLRGSWLEKSV